ncbi:MAG: acetyl-CoA acyltransferase, partial [Kiritimatiellia bacterium]
MPFSNEPHSRRAVIVAGDRTPFVKAFGPFMTLDAVHLGVHAVRGLLQRTGLPWDQIDSIVWGGVVLPSASPNVGREIALELGLPHRVEAVTVSRACASGLQAITQAAAAIERGEVDVVIAGGGDSTSNAEVQLAQKLVHATAPVALKKNAGVRDYLRIVPQLFPLRDVMPRRPRIAERSTGQLMGEAAEDMGGRNHVTREAQDELAARSHHRAAAAWEDGVFAGEVTPVHVGGQTIDRDGLVRADTNVEKLAKLRPVFSRDGTLTAGNSSALTDGASAVLLMSEEKARELGLQPLATLRSWAYVGVDPADQLLMGPALAMPLALERAGLTLDEIDVVDMHEAFAAQ